MNDAAALAARRSWLREWLQYDESRIPEVEKAYREFARQSRMGLAVFCAMLLGIVTAIAVVATHAGQKPAAYAAQLLVLPSIPFYGVIFLAALRVDRNTLRSVLIGVVDPIRASLFAIVLGCFAVVVELFLLATLAVLHAKVPVKQIDPMSAGIAFGLFMLVVVAPVVEEFLVQGWVQTIARPFGPRAAGVVATIVFVVLHAPGTLFELVRAVGLGAAAWLRGWTRCLAACIVVHATMNCILGLFMIVGLHR